MNDFAQDNLWQRQVRDEILAPSYYGKYVAEGRYVFVDKGTIADILRTSAVDTIVQHRDGSAVCIEEKIVRRRYPCFFLETKSCTVPGHESLGWMRTGRANYLLYCFLLEDGSLDTFLIHFKKLQEWFWPLEATFREHIMPERNRTAGRLVPVKAVQDNIPTVQRHVQKPTPSLWENMWTKEFHAPELL